MKNVQHSRADQAQESTISAQGNADRINLHSDDHVTPLTSMALDTGLLNFENIRQILNFTIFVTI